MKKFKLRFTSITVAAIFIVILVVFFVAMAIYGSNSSDYYISSGNSIDAVIYEDESSYTDFLEDNGMTSENAENSELQFIKGASKQLWFDEGNIWNTSSNIGGILSEEGKSHRKNSAVGMTIAYSVSYNESDNTYHIEGHLSFDDSHASIFTFIKEETMDILSVTWGGGLRVDYTSIEASATYSNGKNAYIERNDVSLKEGVSFMIEERSGNKYIEDCSFKFVLEGSDDPSGEPADIDVRYFHSYGTSGINNVSYAYSSDYVGVTDGLDKEGIAPTAQSSSTSRNIWHADLYMLDVLSY